MRSTASRSCAPQSQRWLPKTSPVRHSLCGRISGTWRSSAGTGAVLARGANQPMLEAVVVAAAAAIAGAKLGHDARAAAAEIVPPFAVAVAEDGLAVGLAVVSFRCSLPLPTIGRRC